MKVILGPYKDNWISPYTILEKVFFWRDIDYDEPVIKKWNVRLKPFCEALLAFGNKYNSRKEYVRIDNYDVWNCDSTLALIILPLMKKLKEQKHGSGFVDDEDAPEELRSDKVEPVQEWNWDSNNSKRYDWLLDEVIWTFEQLQPDSKWEDHYWKVHPEIDFEERPEDEGKTTPLRCKTKGVHDKEGYLAHNKRIDNGLRLFGKYYRTFWD